MALLPIKSCKAKYKASTKGNKTHAKLATKLELVHFRKPFHFVLTKQANLTLPKLELFIGGTQFIASLPC